MQESVLIAGGSGMIGGRLTQLLLERGYSVSWLSRSKDIKTSLRVYHWDTEKGRIENGAVEQTDHIINLAGANVGEKRWTEERKKLIIDSRVKSTALLFNTLQQTRQHVKSYISASGISYYGNKADKLLTEEMPPGDDFLGKCCQEWEKAAMQMESLNIRTVRIRTGMVLSDRGGAVPQIAAPVKMGFGAVLGNGQQWVSWIHIDDICRIYIQALENKTMQGAYNGVAPEPVKNKKLIREIAHALGKPIWLPNAPAFVLKIVFGEMSDSVLDSARISAAKILETGFLFNFREIRPALEEIYG